MTRAELLQEAMHDPSLAANRIEGLVAKLEEAEKDRTELQALLWRLLLDEEGAQDAAEKYFGVGRHA